MKLDAYVYMQKTSNLILVNKLAGKINEGTQFLPLIILLLLFFSSALPFICTGTHEIVSKSQSQWI